jgi:uncharacterized membrane protein YgcG
MEGTPPPSPKKKDDKKVGDGAGGNNTKDSAAVFQQLVQEVGSGVATPYGWNYSNWAWLMRVKLKARGLWRAIDVGDVDDLEDMMALNALCLAVPPEMARVIFDKETAMAAWKAIATMRVGDERVNENSAQQLRWEFELATFKDGETVEDFALRLIGMQASLQALGVKLEDKQLVLKILHSAPVRYQQMVVAIRTLLDISMLLVVEVTGRLKASEDSFEEAPATLHHDGKLYMTADEWELQRKKGDGEHAGDGSGSSGGRGGGRSRGQGRGCGNSGSASSRGPVNSSGKVSRDQCRWCAQTEHWARECP